MQILSNANVTETFLNIKQSDKHIKMNTKEDFLSHITLYLLEKNYLDYQDNFSENGDTQRTTPTVTIKTTTTTTKTTTTKTNAVILFKNYAQR